MTPHQWLTCEDPRRLLAHLLRHGRSTDRKLRLAACAVCRLVWGDLTAVESRQAVEAAERFADGWHTAAERAKAHAAAGRARGLAAAAATWAAAGSAFNALDRALDLVGQSASTAPERIFDPVRWRAVNLQQARLLHDVFDDLFLDVRVDEGWLAWNDGAVRRMAEAVYEEGRFGDLPVLADALEEAGCAEEVLLDHCRRPGEHVRGCWALDVLTGRE